MSSPVWSMIADFLTSGNINNNIYYKVGSMYSGKTQAENTKQSANTQISYEDYLKQGYQRALDDWQRNVGSKGLEIRYPELSYPGYLKRADTAITRAGLDISTADANYYGNLLYRGAGLYGIGGRIARFL